MIESSRRLTDEEMEQVHGGVDSTWQACPDLNSKPCPHCEWYQTDVCVNGYVAPGSGIRFKEAGIPVVE